METYMIAGLYFLTAIIWIWALVDLVKSSFRNTLTKLLWLLVILFFPILGSIVYFQFARRYKVPVHRKFQPVFSKIPNRA